MTQIMVWQNMAKIEPRRTEELDDMAFQRLVEVDPYLKEINIKWLLSSIFYQGVDPLVHWCQKCSSLSMHT